MMTASNSNVAMVTYTLAQVYQTLFGPVVAAIMSSWGQWAIAIAK